MTVTDHEVVFERVQACLRNLVGGSGHLATYDLERDSFIVTATRDLDDGCTEYEFHVRGRRVSEFTDVAGEEDGWTTTEEGRTPGDEPGLKSLEGAIVLDEAGGLAVDDGGRVRLTPWRTLDRSLWSAPDGDDGLDELLDRLERDDG